MASELIGASNAPTAPVLATAETDVGKTSNNALKHTNGDSDTANPDTTTHAPGEVKPAEAPKPGDESKSSDIGGSKEPAVTSKTEIPGAGDKREHELTSAEADTDKPASEASEEPADEPTNKKQKTTDNHTETKNGGSSNGEKKKAGRPKKTKEAMKEAVKDTAKKVAPTDGIGSRTRSRTKAT